MRLKILDINPALSPFERDLQQRIDNFENTKRRILKSGETLKDFSNAHHYYGIHRTEDGWVYREWAPGAQEMYFTGDFNFWDRRSCPMEKMENGVFEVKLAGSDALRHGQRVSAIVISDGQELERIPAYANYVVQDPVTTAWHATIFDSATPFPWTDSGFKPEKDLFIYECHIGMAQEEGKVSTVADHTLFTCLTMH